MELQSPKKNPGMAMLIYKEFKVKFTYQNKEIFHNYEKQNLWKKS